jgi:hypothetical protein
MTRYSCGAAYAWLSLIWRQKNTSGNADIWRTGRTSIEPPFLDKTSSGLTEGAPEPLNETLKPIPWLAERLESIFSTKWVYQNKSVKNSVRTASKSL